MSKVLKFAFLREKFFALEVAGGSMDSPIPWGRLCGYVFVHCICLLMCSETKLFISVKINDRHRFFKDQITGFLGRSPSCQSVPQRFGEVDVTSSEFLSLLTEKTGHEAELQQLDQQRESAYFDQMEKREKIEQRLTEIRELKNCKVITCQKCNYTARKQSELCAAQMHRVVRHIATKRFFKCKDCKKRRESYEKYPMAPCDCGSKHFERVSMRDERNGPALNQLKIDEEPKPYYSE